MGNAVIIIGQAQDQAAFDPDDFCRSCRGKKYVSDYTAHGLLGRVGFATVPGLACDGTGRTYGATLYQKSLVKK